MLGLLDRGGSRSRRLRRRRSRRYCRDGRLWPAGVGDDDVVGHPARDDAAGKPGRRDQRDQRRCHRQNPSGRDQRRAPWIVDVGNLLEARIPCRSSVLPLDLCSRRQALSCFTLSLDAGGLCVSACGFDAFALEACGFCVSTFGFYEFLLNARRFRLTSFRFRAFPLDELRIGLPAFGFQALPLDLCGFRSMTLRSKRAPARGARLPPVAVLLLRAHARFVPRPPLRGARSLRAPARRVPLRLPVAKASRAFPLELLALGAQLRKRAADEVVSPDETVPGG